MSGNILELGMVNSVQNPPSLFATFFVGNIFGRGIVFCYVWKYFVTRNGNFCMNCPFFLQHILQEIELEIVLFYIWKYGGIRNGKLFCTNSPLLFCNLFLQDIFSKQGLYFSIPRNILELGIMNSVGNPLSFFATFFVGHIFELGIVFFYLCKYFGTRYGEFRMKSSHFPFITIFCNVVLI